VLEYDYEGNELNDVTAKDKIINTTIDMIQTKGYNNISTNHIAEQAGISIGTLYYHFKNGKPDIVKELLIRGYAEFLDEVKLEYVNQDNFPQFLKEFLERYIRQHKKNKSLIVAIEMALLTNKSLFRDLEYIQTELKLIPIISKVLLQVGYSYEKDIENVSKMLLRSIDTIIHRHVIYEDFVKNDEELVEFLRIFIIRFLGLDKKT
jgi:TetR/AcrR family transcriptional regulator